MLSTVDRYLIKELALAILATMLVLLAMVLSHRLAGYLSDAASGLLAQESILLLLGLQAIRYLVLLVPLASLLAIMFTLGRLYRDSEMTALKACGLGPGAIYRPLFIIMGPLAIMLVGLALFVVPRCMELQHELQTKARQDAQVSVFRPGVFRSVLDGKHMIYVNGITAGGKELRKIFVQSRESGRIAITTAETGHQEIDPVSGDRYIVLVDGFRYEGTPGQGDFRNMRFQRLAIRVDSAPPEEPWVRREMASTKQLWESGHPAYLAELHSRISGPVSLLLIAFLTPLLADAKPREGRYGRMVAAILIYTIYVNLLGVGDAWLKRGQIPTFFGLWWVHAGFGLLALGLWARQYGFALPLLEGSRDRGQRP